MRNQLLLALVALLFNVGDGLAAEPKKTDPSDRAAVEGAFAKLSAACHSKDVDRAAQWTLSHQSLGRSSGLMACDPKRPKDRARVEGVCGELRRLTRPGPLESLRYYTEGDDLVGTIRVLVVPGLVEPDVGFNFVPVGGTFALFDID